LPPVWEWSQQLFIKDQALFNNPIYVGKGARYVHNGAVKSFRRTKVSGTGVPVNAALLAGIWGKIDCYFTTKCFAPVM